jgi:hypothetical protein
MVDPKAIGKRDLEAFERWASMYAIRGDITAVSETLIVLR